MKKKFYILAMLWPLFGFSQKLVFSYDESGNQIERKEGIRSSRAASEELLASIEKYESNDTISNGFMVYPNPTTGPITLKWKEEYLGKVASITLSDMVGRSEEIEFKSNELEVQVDLTTKLQGVYIINFHLIEGPRVDKKIIKQN